MTTKKKQLDPFLCEEFCPHPHVVNSALDMMPTDVEISKLSDTFKIFGDNTRLRIIYALYMGEMCVCDISESLSISQSAVSHQLRLLRNTRLVKTRREGKSIFYSLDDDHIYSIMNQGLAHIRHTHDAKEE